MRSVIVSWLFTLRASLRDRAALQLEILALRHQLQVLNGHAPAASGSPVPTGCSGSGCQACGKDGGQRSSSSSPRPSSPGIGGASACFWTWKSRHRPGRPAVSADVRALIRTMAA